MYQLPLRFFLAGPTTGICATRIVAIMSMKSFQTRNIFKKEKKSNNCINAAGINKVLSIIVLDSGTIVASPYNVNTLMNRIEKSNMKSLRPMRNQHKMTVYDVTDGQFPKDTEENAEEISVAYDDEVEEESIEEEIFEEESDDNVNIESWFAQEEQNETD